jgi:hypothetical protein
MRRCTVLLLVAALMCAGMLTAYAADVNQDSPTGSMDVTMSAKQPDPIYTVQIPSEVDFGTQVIAKTSTPATKEFTVSISDMANFNNKVLYVTVTGGGPDGAFQLVNTENSAQVVPMKLLSGDLEILPGEALSSVIESASTENLSGILQVDAKDIPGEGNYQGTITFQFALK